VIHVGGREQQQDVLTGNRDLAEFPEKLALTTQCAAVALAQVVEEDDASIVAIGIVLWARIPEAHNQFQGMAWHSDYLAESDNSVA
jgi:hypothetical protein